MRTEEEETMNHSLISNIDHRIFPPSPLSFFPFILLPFNLLFSMKGMTPGNVGASAGAAPKAVAPAAVKPPKTELQNGKQWTIVSRFALILSKKQTEI